MVLDLYEIACPEILLPYIGPSNPPRKYSHLAFSLELVALPCNLLLAVVALSLPPTLPYLLEGAHIPVVLVVVSLVLMGECTELLGAVETLEELELVEPLPLFSSLLVVVPVLLLLGRMEVVISVVLFLVVARMLLAVSYSHPPKGKDQIASLR